jgi:hypothetical protein
MGKEASAALDFSFNVLKDDTTLAPLITDQTGVHIYQRQAPAGVWNLTDYYVFGSIMSPGSDFIGGFGVRLMTDPLLLWYAVKKGQIDQKLLDIDKALDNVLTNIRAQIDANSSLQFSIVREKIHDRTTRDGAGATYTEVGGLYRYYIS